MKVIILVDAKTRDLDAASLIAFHLRRKGVECILEPLEADRAALAGHKPDLILFNHLTASHLITYSRRLHELGVLTAVLPNEGIQYDEMHSRFAAGRHHNDSHIDLFFCWNERHKKAVEGEDNERNIKPVVVGVPRFDFYFQPWAGTISKPTWPTGGRPVVLMCGNFGVGHFWNLPRSEGDKLFALWANRVPLFKNYWHSIEVQWNGQKEFIEYLKQVVHAEKYFVIVRPHPMEDFTPYKQWLDVLPEHKRKYVHFEGVGTVTPLILRCDLQVSCETCTTAMEAWIANKPTIELRFEDDPTWRHMEQSRLNDHCHDPSALIEMIDARLGRTVPPEKQVARQAHLAKWCGTLRGDSCLRVAEAIVGALAQNKRPDFSSLTSNEKRRGIKLRIKRAFGLAYHYDLLLPIKRFLFPKRYAIKTFNYLKAVKPADADVRQRELEDSFAAHHAVQPPSMARH